MQEGTARLKAVVESVDSLVQDLRDGKIFLKDFGGLIASSVMLKAILGAQLQRETARAARDLPRGPMDYTLPRGDRDDFPPAA